MEALHDYDDFRAYLRDRFTRENLSLSQVAKKLGLKSTNYVGIVLTGKRNFSNAHVLALRSCLYFTEEEFEHFFALVNYSQAETDEEREYFRQKLMVFRREKPDRIYHSGAPLGDHYLATWYYPILHQHVLMRPTPSVSDLSRMLRLSPDIIEKGIQDLIDNGFIQRDEKGQLSALSVTSAVTGQMISKHMKPHLYAQIQRALQEYEREYARDGNFYSQTMVMSNAAYKRCWEDIRKALLKAMEDHEVAPFERVTQINVQMYSPLAWR